MFVCQRKQVLENKQRRFSTFKQRALSSQSQREQANKQIEIGLLEEDWISTVSVKLFSHKERQGAKSLSDFRV